MSGRRSSSAPDVPEGRAAGAALFFEEGEEVIMTSAFLFGRRSPLVRGRALTKFLNGNFEPSRQSRRYRRQDTDFKVSTVKNWIVAGVALVALTAAAAPASAAAAAATNPELPAPGSNYGGAADQAISAFYASRGGAPLWLTNPGAANALMGALQRASLEVFHACLPVAASSATRLPRKRQHSYDESDPAASSPDATPT